MPDIKTRDIAKGTIKTIDKSAVAAERMKSTFMFKRNRHLVNGSSVCIAYLTQEKGGTAYTVNYARQNNVQVINLAAQ